MAGRPPLLFRVDSLRGDESLLGAADDLRLEQEMKTLHHTVYWMGRYGVAGGSFQAYFRKIGRLILDLQNYGTLVVKIRISKLNENNKAPMKRCDHTMIPVLLTFTAILCHGEAFANKNWVPLPHVERRDVLLAGASALTTSLIPPAFASSGSSRSVLSVDSHLSIPVWPTWGTYTRGMYIACC